MRYHRLRRMLRVRDWTKTAASLLVLASEALFTTFVLYALNGYDQTVIRDKSMLNQHFYVQVCEHVAYLSLINSLMKCTYYLSWLKFLQNDHTGWTN